ncbi:aminoglycoside phosphotransferase (APT) family kinase protein [Roseivirga pacifica]|uniref:Predicted kinase, aminoglycoside phosphotransferase (APT) family n=1 Tax=Roseivirga pacifica TaxID=1267423 RepID=A0A1I0NAA8_9BACT|nr:aminoglycoside phosphotransferase family protein [Roseivirga pacifica]RKQ51046.1 aminoglycoside phosphotransferase (APT) family kinase protein [Roseivirga pacifica]SEV98208.1 Predicted kinase, aminoglycoside phosphotransferase (APT) family [Roseivirga pacifica]
MRAEEALKYFQIEGAVEQIAPFGLGHINDTYIVRTSEGEYLLQQVNTQVFKKPEVLEQNIARVVQKFPKLFPAQLKATENRYHLIGQDFCWRMQAFMSDTYSPNEVKSEAETRAVASGYAQMMAAFVTEDASNYELPIPRFHDLNWRLEQLDDAINTNFSNRLEGSKTELEGINSFRWVAEKMDELIAEGLPLRLCHNDTKTGNILLNKADKSFAKVIDLDTLGPGYVLNDYGDIMRSLFTIAPENEADHTKIVVRPAYLDILKEEFQSLLAQKLTPIELQTLEFGGLCMTYITAIRFFTDYLNGDIYYKTSFDKENLVRAKNQLRLLELMKDYVD